MPRPARIPVVLVMAAALAGGPAAASGEAAVGDVAFLGCIGKLAGCTPTSPADALEFSVDPVASADGRHLYVTGQVADAVSHFTVDAAGKPTFAGCVGALAGCTPTNPVGALDGASGLARSADGKHLYAAARNSDAISHLTLDAAGNPTFAGCVGNLAGCGSTNPADALDSAYEVTTTADGNNLYAAALGANTVSHFKLDGTGTPTFFGCIGNHAGCTSTLPSGALNGAADVASTSDGKHLYAAALSPGQISHFTIRPTGGLDFVGCIGALNGCAPTSPVGGAHSLVLAADGKHLYAAARLDDVVDHFTLDVAGNLAAVGCTGQAFGCSATTPSNALEQVGRLALSPDGRHLYATSDRMDVDGAVSHLRVDTVGNTSFAGCIGTLAGCKTTIPAGALAVSVGVATAPDGRHLYASGLHGVSYLAIEQAPPPPGPAPIRATAPPAFGARTLVTLKLAARRIPARGPVKVTVANANGFEVTGRLGGETVNRVSVSRTRRVKLRARSFRVAAHAKKTVRLRLPKVLRRLLARTGKLKLRLIAKVKDPAGNTRTVKKRVTPRLKKRRR